MDLPQLGPVAVLLLKSRKLVVCLETPPRPETLSVTLLMMVVVYRCIQNAWTSVMVTIFAVSMELSFVKSTAKFHYYILFEY